VAADGLGERKRAGGTEERILDTAEWLFAERGFNGTSLRAITSGAGVNLAAVHYHFRSKDALLQAVFKRRMGPLNQRRLELLEACRAGSRRPSLEDVLEAMAGPVIRLKKDAGRGGEQFARLLGRAMFEPGENLLGILYREFKDVFMRFTEVLQEVLPDVPPEEVFWRVHFLGGAIAFNMVNPKHLTMTSGGLCDSGDVEAAVGQLVAFAAGGFRASVKKR
jgi:AcrR family transcriptional regulator